MIIKTRNDFHLLLEDRKLNGFGVEIGVMTGTFSEILLNTTKLEKYILQIHGKNIQNQNIMIFLIVTKNNKT